MATDRHILRGRSIDGTVYWAGGATWVDDVRCARRATKGQAMAALADRVLANSRCELDDTVGRLAILPAPPLPPPQPAPLDPALHDQLMAQGYTYRHEPASWEDTGDAESGPHVTGGPAFDQYTGTRDYVYTDGSVVSREPRDWELERWVDAHMGEQA